jgi:filamentous hemagglutinin family protein
MSRKREILKTQAGVGLGIVFLLPGVALAELPIGGVVTQGIGSVSVHSGAMTINQTTPNLVADWQSFSVGAGNVVEFVQPSASATALNRVIGADVSSIQGSIRANGQVFLLNPNGILFTPTAQVNVGGLIASTLNISDQDFLNGELEFQGNSPNAVINQGSISSNGGNVALIAARIVNDPGASITADRGQVLMGAGSKVTLDLGGSVRIRINEGALQALIEQGGAVRADGGLVYLTAKSASALGQTVINHTGVTRAQTVSTGPNGEIFLMGGMEADSIRVSGTLDASAPSGGDGGFIETSAANVRIMDDVAITTSAAQGNDGQWLIDPIDFYVKASGGNVSGATISAALTNTNVTIDTRTAGSGAAACTHVACSGGAGTAGDIFVQDNITRSSGGPNPTTLTFLANRNVEIGGISQVQLDGDREISSLAAPNSVTIGGSTGNPLNVVVSARAAGASTGEVRMVNSTISTFGGNVAIGGGNNTATDYAIAHATKTTYDNGVNRDEGYAGVRIRNSVIDASADGGAQVATNNSGWWLGPHSYVSQGSASISGGSIDIRGKSNLSEAISLGIWLYGGASLTTAGNGTVSLDGVGGAAGTQSFGRVGSTGVVIEGRSPIIAKDGAISITGQTGGSRGAYGVAFTEGNGLIQTMGALNINAADSTASDKEDNAILIRDGNMTFRMGANSEFHAPLVGGTDNTSISQSYSFTKEGDGQLTFMGSVPVWNETRPNLTPEPKTSGTYTVAAGSLSYGAGVSQAGALFSFLPPPTDGAFGYGPGAIAPNAPSVLSSAEMLRISLARQNLISRGVAPRNATTEERNQAANNRGLRLSAMGRGGALPPNATAEEIETYNRIRKINELRINAGQIGPMMNAEERARALKVKAQIERRAMIASGKIPPNATIGEVRAAVTIAVKNTVRNVFRGLFRR